MNKASVLWLSIIAVAAAIALGLVQPGAAQPARPVFAPAGECPVQNTPAITYAYGSVQLDGAAAAPDTLIQAINPRGDVVGCWVVDEGKAGNYGSMPIYGEDTSISPPIPGMRSGETVLFRVNGAPATAAPPLVWQNDKDYHQIALTAWSPTPTPTPTNTPTPTSTPTGSNQPDLIVQSISVDPTTPVAGQSFNILVVIKNQGQVNVDDIFFTGLYVDRGASGAPDSDAWLLSLAAGATDTVIFSRSLGAGSHVLASFADWDNEIVESNEANNKRTIAIQVAALPVVPVVTVSRGAGSSIVLTWPHASANASYQVRRAISPYFTFSSGSIIGDGATGNCANNGVVVTCTDANALGNPSINYFYQVRAFNAVGTSADSNRVGEFDFTLVPGSQ